MKFIVTAALPLWVGVYCIEAPKPNMTVLVVETSQSKVEDFEYSLVGGWLARARAKMAITTATMATLSLPQLLKLERHQPMVVY